MREAILEHYRVAAPLIAANFAGTPFIYTTFPHGLARKAAWHGAIFHSPPFRPPPKGAETVPVPGKHGVRRFLSVTGSTLLHLVQDEGAVEFYGWGCEPSDPLRARFARVLLELDATAAPSAATLPESAKLLRAILQQRALDAIPLLSGENGIALWIPLDGSPDYDTVRTTLHTICAEAVQRYPQRFCTEPNSHASGRVHLHVNANAPGRGTALPYSLRAGDALPVCTPVCWDELLAGGDTTVTAANFARRLHSQGDVFAALLQQQRTGSITLIESQKKPIEPHGYILRAAIEILQDGVARDAKTILARALARGLVPPQTSSKYVYTSLLEYIVRTAGHGHRPVFVQNADRTFRINEPPDPWPATDVPSAPPLAAKTQALIDRLQATAKGGASAAFELAVCDAFAHLGFASTHVGGQSAPDGYADAQLGVLGYRVMLECKSGAQIVNEPDAVEAAKYKNAYAAQCCALVGPQFSEEVELSGRATDARRQRLDDRRPRTSAEDRQQPVRNALAFCAGLRFRLHRRRTVGTAPRRRKARRTYLRLSPAGGLGRPSGRGQAGSAAECSAASA